jgi:O-antigen ligase
LFAIFQFIIGPENILDWITGFFGKYFMDFNTVLERISQENYHWRWNNTVKAFGTFVNVNTFCAYLGLSFPIALALCILTPNKKTKKLLFLYLTLNCIVIVLTFSRGGLLSGLFVAVYIILLLNKYIKLKTKLRITFMFIIVALIAYTVLHQVIDIMLMRLQTLDFSSNYERILLWKGAWNVITDNMFFGVGVGNYEKIIKYYLPLNAPIAPAHNNILQLWAEVGLIGLSPFLLLILILMQQLIRISIHSSEYLIKSISAGLSGSFLWFLTQGMLSVFYFELKYGMLFWLLIGITVVLIRKINKLQWYTGVL